MNRVVVCDNRGEGSLQHREQIQLGLELLHTHIEVLLHRVNLLLLALLVRDDELTVREHNKTHRRDVEQALLVEILVVAYGSHLQRMETRRENREKNAATLRMKQSERPNSVGLQHAFIALLHLGEHGLGQENRIIHAVQELDHDSVTRA